MGKKIIKLILLACALILANPTPGVGLGDVLRAKSYGERDPIERPQLIVEDTRQAILAQVD